MKITEYLKENLIFLDGGMGTLLQAQGLKAGELPERLNITKPEVITKIHKDYFDAGCNVVNANTFGANLLKFKEDELEEIIKCAILNAKKAKEQSQNKTEKWVALDIGPTGKMLKPFGDLDFEDAVKIFAKTVELGAKHGAELVIIETMNDSYETKAALLAVKENCDLPVFVSNAYGEDGRLMTGATPSAMVAMLEGLGADAIGVNCSFGPEKLAPVVEEYLKFSSLPVLLKPNAGLPKAIDGKTVYDVKEKEFTAQVKALIEKGVRIAGGCCGTTPEYIKELVSQTKSLMPKKITKKTQTIVSSYAKSVVFDDQIVLIGERINPTGKKRFKEALKTGDIDYILSEGVRQQEKGVHVLDVNVGLPEIDECETLKRMVCELQAVIDLPLQIDTSDFKAMEIALRRYNGKAMINSVNLKEESISAVFPLVKKYGGVVVALTLDKNGIPETAEGRLDIASKILQRAIEYGIDPKDVIFDPLALTVSADANSGLETLRAVKLISEKLKAKTSLGLSNVSFGLPQRDTLNATFFAMALREGLSAAIMNPYSEEMMKSYYSYRALSNLDSGFTDYVRFVNALPQKMVVEQKVVQEEQLEQTSALQNAIIKGLKEQAQNITKELIKENQPLSIVQAEIIPALNVVGERFENKKLYLPQLLMSAESAKTAFEVIRGATEKQVQGGVPFVIATVEGDIHDIGKNIVKLLLENYGFSVTDLGKDVPPQVVVDAVLRVKAKVVGLSALMTTTVPSMEKTIKLLRESAPWCKVVVGGAVLNEEYAKMIGADFYAKDALSTVRYAQTQCE